MDWEHMRAHYVRALRAARDRGVTQKRVADAGGLKGQNYISKIKSAPRLGPAVELFIRAIEGLGISPSEFFAELEGRPPRELPPIAAPASTFGTSEGDGLADAVLEKSFIVNAVIETLQRGVAAPAAKTSRRRRRKKH
jgi:transcriptional regulator with XRE-family HTH domain